MRRALTHGTATAIAMTGLLAAGTPAMAAEGGAPAQDVATAPADSGLSVEYGAPFVLDEGEAADSQGQMSTDRVISALYGAEPVEPETRETNVSGEAEGQSGGINAEANGDADSVDSRGEEVASDEGAHEETHIGAIVGVAAGVVVVGAAAATALARRRGRHSDSPDDFDDLQETIID